MLDPGFCTVPGASFALPGGQDATPLPPLHPQIFLPRPLTASSPSLSGILQLLCISLQMAILIILWSKDFSLGAPPRYSFDSYSFLPFPRGGVGPRKDLTTRVWALLSPVWAAASCATIPASTCQTLDLVVAAAWQGDPSKSVEESEG